MTTLRSTRRYQWSAVPPSVNPPLPSRPAFNRPAPPRIRPTLRRGGFPKSRGSIAGRTNPPARKSEFTRKVWAAVKAHRVRITASLLLIALIAILAAR